MASRRVALLALAALVAAARPAIADDQGPHAPAPPIAQAPAAAGRVAPRVGLALTIVGGVLTLASAYLVVRGYQHRNDLNPDASIAETGYGVVIGVPSLLLTVVGVALLVPDDAGAGANGPNTNPRFAGLPRGLALRFTF
jgi:hypothetical protein